jgi:hypothetical protein
MTIMTYTVFQYLYLLLSGSARPAECESHFTSIAPALLLVLPQASLEPSRVKVETAVGLSYHR